MNVFGLLDISNISHKLFKIILLIFFILLTLSFIQEATRGVQRLVEAPYVYLIARSGSSVKDQLLYVPARLEDIAEIDQEISDGYRDKLRFFSGEKNSHLMGPQ